jgi:hypothetical protein
MERRKSFPVDSKLLPKELQPDQALQFSAEDYPIEQTNPVTGYRTFLFRVGVNADTFGWIQLLNDHEPAGYIYIKRPLTPPFLGSLSPYVVMDFPPDLMETLLTLLTSGEPLQISFQQSANEPASAVLGHRE